MDYTVRQTTLITLVRFVPPLAANALSLTCFPTEPRTPPNRTLLPRTNLFLLIFVGFRDGSLQFRVCIF